jgi:hypothetical protein
VSDSWDILESWQHACGHLKLQILLVAQPVRAALDDANFVVQPLDESERPLVLGPAISGDPIASLSVSQVRQCPLQ